MKKKNFKILVTLGPSSLTKKFLIFAKASSVSLLRLNMSHIEANKLEKIIKFIRKWNNKTPICIDTEGAQIRTKVKKKQFLSKGKELKLFRRNGNFNLYPLDVFEKLKVRDILLIGFENLAAKISKVEKEFIKMKVIAQGTLESNKGVHIKNRLVKLNYLTDKDFKAIEIGKKNNVKNFALSFTNNLQDIHKFKKILKKENKIYKLETMSAIRNLKNIKL